MKIGFDAKRAYLNHSGLGNYSRNLIRGLYRYFPEHRYFLYTTKQTDAFAADGLDYNFKVISPKGPSPSHALWRSFGIANSIKQDQLDIYHGLSHELPLSNLPKSVKKVLTFHDLIYLRYPQHFPWIDRKLYNYKYKKSAQKADRIIAISEQTKQDLINFYRIPERKITVIYQNCDPAFARNVGDKKKVAVCKKYQLPDSFFLNVGTFNYRKNQAFLVQAFDQIADNSELDLVLVGSGGDHLSKVQSVIADSKHHARIHLLTSARHDDLPAIYQMAKAYVNTSMFEGFGLPLLEALTGGIPVISADGSCFTEFQLFTHNGLSFYEQGNAEQLQAILLKVAELTPPDSPLTIADDIEQVMKVYRS